MLETHQLDKHFDPFVCGLIETATFALIGKNIHKFGAIMQHLHTKQEEPDFLVKVKEGLPCPPDYPLNYNRAAFCLWLFVHNVDWDKVKQLLAEWEVTFETLLTEQPTGDSTPPVPAVFGLN